MFRKIVSYEDGVWFSNSASGTLGRMRRRNDRQADLASLTGAASSFRGDYGGRNFQPLPEILDTQGVRLIQAPQADDPWGPNHVSAYDLTRVLSMIAWHRDLASSQRVPRAQWHSLEPLVRALTHDSARYVDVAFEHLGVARRLRDVVILSKLGHGIRVRDGSSGDQLHRARAVPRRPSGVVESRSASRSESSTRIRFAATRTPLRP